MDDEKTATEKTGQLCQVTRYLNVQKSKLSGGAGRDNLQPSKLSLVLATKAVCGACSSLLA